MSLLKRTLSLFLCACLCFSGLWAAYAQEAPSSAAGASSEEQAQWEQWAAEDEATDTSAETNAIPLTPEEEKMLEGLSASLNESFHLDPVDLSNLSKNEALPSNVFNILLLGIDNRSAELQRGRSDANMVCSINMETGEVKLVSIARDTAVTIPGMKQMNRINTAYFYGGAELSMKTVNLNYQLNIDRYVVVNIHGLSAIIDALGGVDMDMTALEAKRINFELRKEPMDDVKRANVKGVDGVQHLDGMQAVTFARIRGIDSDLERTRRQRQLLETLLKQVMQDMSIAKLMTLIETALPYGDTNLTLDELLTLGSCVMGGTTMGQITKGEEAMAQLRVPMNKHYGWKKFGDFALLYLNDENLKYTIDSVHEFLYGQSYYTKP